MMIIALHALRVAMMIVTHKEVIKTPTAISMKKPVTGVTRTAIHPRVTVVHVAIMTMIIALHVHRGAIMKIIVIPHAVTIILANIVIVMTKGVSPVTIIVIALIPIVRVMTITALPIIARLLGKMRIRIAGAMKKAAL
jgi:hypothetical protein